VEASLFANYSVDHVDQLRAGSGAPSGRKCDTCKALEFSTPWFGTRRSKVQILWPRPLQTFIGYATFFVSTFASFCGSSWTNQTYAFSPFLTERNIISEL